MQRRNQADYKSLYLKAANYCAYQDRCIHEVHEKLSKWGLEEEKIPVAIEQLQEEKYLDQERYTRSYARGKFYYQKWGKIKIRQALKLKQVDESLIQKAMNEEIKADDYDRVLTRILYKKYHQLFKEEDLYKRKMKTVQHAAQKGYEPNVIYALIDEAIQMNEDDFEF
ncbi:regulatory protein RecX [Persicobacter psychrovividus]|uniref:Regulatory protein RecX n=1 Tax=Persicobacter psychrovividus TaxID=387638 RepID=A0ABN6L494_9BACT|nr:regulatory protein RecX [Persicobacter psychrovividus]